jgi:WD40 repeat protein
MIPVIAPFVMGCSSSLPPPGPTARERFQARQTDAIGSAGPSLQVPPEIPPATRLGRGGGMPARTGPTAQTSSRSPSRSSPRDADRGRLEALEGGGWALRGRDRVLRIVDPERGIVAVTTGDGRPTPDGRWVLPSAERLDPAPMEGVRRIRRGDSDWIWGDQHAVALRRDAKSGGGPRQEPVGASPDGRWVPRSVGPTPAGWLRAARPPGLLLEETDGRAGPELPGCLSETDVRWSPDASRLTCRTERGLSAFDVRGRALGEWAVAERGFDPHDVAWSPRLDRLALVGEGQVLAWDLDDGPSSRSTTPGVLWRRRVAGPEVRLSAVFTDDGSLVVVTDGDATAVLDAADGTRLDAVDRNPAGTADRVALLADGGVVAATRSTLSWWSPQGERRGTVYGPRDPLAVDGRACWLEDCPQPWRLERTVLVSEDGRRIPLEVEDWARIDRRSPSGRWWLVQARGEARAVDLEQQEVHPIERRGDPLAIDDQGAVWRATAEGVEGVALDGSVEVVAVGRPVRALEVHPELLLVGLAGGEIRKIARPPPSSAPSLPQVPPRPRTLVRALPSGAAWLPDGRLVVGGRDPLAVDPDALVEGTLILEPAPEPSAPVGPRLEPRGRGWTLVDGDERLEIPGLPRGRGAAVSADGQKVAVLEDTGVWVWSRTAGTERRVPVNRPSAVALSPDGGRLAMSAGGQVELVDLASGVIRQVAPAPRDPHLAFSPDGRWLAIGPAPLALLEVESGAVRFDAASDTFQAVDALALSPDGLQLAILDDRGRLALWDLETGARSWRSEPLGQPESVRFVSDGVLARLQTGTVLFEPAGHLLDADLAPAAEALSIDDQGQVQVLDSALGWVRWDPATGLPARLGPRRRDPAWSEVTGGVRATWAIPGFAGSVPPDEPPCVSVPTSMACSSMPTDRAPVVTAGLSWVSPSPGGTSLIGRKAEGDGWVLRGPGGVETALPLSKEAAVAWAGAGQAIAVGSRWTWQIRADGKVERSPSPRSATDGVAADGARLAVWTSGAVVIGPIGSDATSCVLPGSATALAAFSPNGRFLAWAGHGELKVADLEQCRIVLSASQGRQRASPPERALRIHHRRPDEAGPWLDELGSRGVPVRRWDVSELGSVSAVGRGPGDAVALATNDGEIRILDLSALPELPLDAFPVRTQQRSLGGSGGGLRRPGR